MFEDPDRSWNFLEYSSIVSYTERQTEGLIQRAGEVQFMKVEFIISGHNDFYQRNVMKFLDVLGNIGGVLGLIFPVLNMIMSLYAEHFFVIKFIKMAFIKR